MINYNLSLPLIEKIVNSEGIYILNSLLKICEKYRIVIIKLINYNYIDIYIYFF